MDFNNFFKDLIEETAQTHPFLFKSELEENQRLQDELEKRKFEIRTKNFFDIMNNRLIPYVRALELAESGILLTNEQLYERAHEMFVKAKQDGVIDDLNNIVKDEVI